MDGPQGGLTSPTGMAMPSSTPGVFAPVSSPMAISQPTSAQNSVASPTGSPPPGFMASMSSSQAATVSSNIGGSLPSSTSPPPSLPTLDSIFREFLYRTCRDTLFWIEAERYRMNPVAQKATFILRTFFTEGGEFCLTREDFPPQFDPLFSKQRPAAPGPMLLEAQDHTKTRLIQAMGPAFTQSSLMLKLNTNPAGLMKELQTPAIGGSLATFLAPRPVSTATPPVIPGGQTSAPSTPTAAPSAMLSPHGTVTQAPESATTTRERSPVLSRPLQTPTALSVGTTSPISPPISPTTSPASIKIPDTSFTQANPAVVSPHQTGTSIASPRGFASTVDDLPPSDENLGVSTAQISSRPSSPPPTHSSANPTQTLPTAATAFQTAHPSQFAQNQGQLSAQGGAMLTRDSLAAQQAQQLLALQQQQQQLQIQTAQQSGTAPSSTALPSGPSIPKPTGYTPGQAPPSLFTFTTSTSSQSTPNIQGLSGMRDTTTIASPSSAPSTPGGHNAPTLVSQASSSKLSLDRRPSRGTLMDETLTSTKLKMGSAPAPLKSSAPSPRVNVIQLVGAVRDKVGLAKKDKERKEREKYFDASVNGWMFMESPTLDDLIHDPNMMILYYDFLKGIHAEENMVCWLEIEFYKFSHASKDSRRNTGVDLLVKYFEPSSKSLINIEGINYKDILKDLNERPARDLFDAAQRVLWDQLAFQCFVRFKDSEPLRRLFEEPTIKGKKKELLKLAQKNVKSNSDNSSFMQKLEEFSKFKAGYVSLVPNVSEREFQLEDILYSSDLLIAFREYLNTLGNSSEYLDALSFWFEVEIWRHSPKDNYREVAQQILKDYLLASPGSVPKVSILGFDTKPMEQEVQERPDKNTFTRVQIWAWKKLKLEQFPNFENSETLTKFFDGNLPMRQNLPIVRHCELLNELRAKNANEATLKANVAKVVAKIRVKRQEVQGTTCELEYILADKEYVQILCEFLDKRQARENLTFWTDAEFYKYLTSPLERAVAANKIWERFFSDKAETIINVDVTDKSALQQMLKDPHHLPDTLFVNCQDTIFTLISYDLIPKFSASEQGQKMLKASKRRPPNQATPSFKAGGLQAVKDLRSWLGMSDLV